MYDEKIYSLVYNSMSDCSITLLLNCMIKAKVDEFMNVVITMNAIIKMASNNIFNPGMVMTPVPPVKI